MPTRIVLAAFSLALLGASQALAGVMLEFPEHDADRGASVEAMSMSVEDSGLSDVELQCRPCRCPKTSNDTAGSIATSVSVSSGAAIASVIDAFIAVPRVDFRLVEHNSAYPPSPDLDGLIKPPQKGC